MILFPGAIVTNRRLKGRRTNLGLQEQEIRNLGKESRWEVYWKTKVEEQKAKDLNQKVRRLFIKVLDCSGQIDLIIE